MQDTLSDRTQTYKIVRPVSVRQGLSDMLLWLTSAGRPQALETLKSIGVARARPWLVF
jgi:hypothetical protein